MGAVAGVPLKSKDHVLGVMHLAIATQQLFPTFDFDLFKTIGVQIGIAAENAVLFQRTMRQTKQIKSSTTLRGSSRRASRSKKCSMRLPPR